MKRYILLMALFSLSATGTIFSQKIIMKIPTITDKAGEEVRSLDYGIEAQSSWTKGGGASVGKPNPGMLKIRKTNNRSTSEFLKNIGAGRSFTEISFEYYDQSQKLIYSITIGGVYLTEVSYVTPECNNCPKLEMQVAMVFKTFEANDVITGVKTKWDIPAGAIQ